MILLAQNKNIMSVIISDRRVEIKVRDRTLNLIRVRFQHFKSNGYIIQLASKVNEYGSVSRKSWDTYQDRSLPQIERHLDRSI